MRNWLVCAAAFVTCIADAAPAQMEAAPYQRVVEEGDGEVLRLELAVRRFDPPEGRGWPVIHLAGAVHIGDLGYYERLQHFLDSQELVLFEGVKPDLIDNEAAASDEARAAITRLHMQRTAEQLARHLALHGAYPADLAELAEASPRHTRAPIDGWGAELEYGPIDGEVPGYELLSRGADALPGGEGPGADIRMLDPARRGSGVRTAPAGIQQKLAEALGLAFQLEAIDYARPHWRNSDMSMREVRRRLDAGGKGGDALFGMLEGTSISGWAAGMMLGLVAGSPSMQTAVKLMLLETISRADDLLSAAPGGLGHVMRVLINDRNGVVLEDLRGLLESDAPPASIAVFYGAGHLPDLEWRLREELGYVPAEDLWLAAIEVDVREAGMTVPQARQFREMMKRSIDAQLARPARDGRGR